MQMLLQTICSHMTFQLLLMCLQGWCCAGVWENIAYLHHVNTRKTKRSTSRECSRPISSSRSGRCSNPFRRLSVTFWRSSSCCAAWSALVKLVSMLQLPSGWSKGKNHTEQQSYPVEYACFSDPVPLVGSSSASRASYDALVAPW
jgi:hypothetical protein